MSVVYFDVKLGEHITIENVTCVSECINSDELEVNYVNGLEFATAFLEKKYITSINA